jgi:GDP-L-fucose synthase
MNENPVDYWLDNVTANNNVLRTAFEFQTWVGPIRVLSILSTTIFPINSTFPVECSQLYAGPPPAAAESYSFAKRSLAQLTQWYRKQHQCHFSCVLPGNFFGAYGGEKNWNPKTAPLVNALIAKAETAKSRDGAILTVMGTGKVQRQIMSASDLASVCVWAVFHYDEIDPLIVAGEEISIADLVELVCEATEYVGEVHFDASAVEGALRRTADTSLLHYHLPHFTFTPLSDAIRKTVQWYRDNQKPR